MVPDGVTMEGLEATFDKFCSLSSSSEAKQVSALLWLLWEGSVKAKQECDTSRLRNIQLSDDLERE